MPKIAPFRGIRYSLDAVNLDDVTSPPYDVISPADADYYHRRHPKNVVRLILGQDTPNDSPTDNRFTRAAAYWEEWLAHGILTWDARPALYAYEQHYTCRGQPKTVRGFISLVKLHDYADGVVLPHENTLAKPKSDLAQLIRAANANLDSVYALYPDPEHLIDGILNRVAAAPPVGEATDRDDVRHRLWLIQDENDVNLISRTLADRQIVIADGHHRYETALAYRDEMRARDGGRSGEQPCDYVMMTLVNIHAPDVIVFPTHRMVRNLAGELLEDFERQLSETSELTQSSRDRLTRDMETHEGKAIGIYRPGWARVALPRRSQADSIPGPPAVGDLDVCILHELILNRILGIGRDPLLHEANVAYTQTEQEALNAVDSGEFQIAFFLNPIRLEVMLEVARTGQKMPQKSTYFYPKLLSGLVMRKIEW